MLKETEEQKLIQECLKGVASSQKLLFEKFSGKMYAVCLRYCDNKDSAKDILQEGFIRVFTHLNKYKFEGSFEGWIRRIMINTAIEFYRKEFNNPKVTGEISLQNHSQDIPGGLEKLKLQDLLNIISRLPSGYRTVFNLYVVEGYAHKEIAKMMGISVNTSKTQLRKARLQLMELIRKER